MSGQSSVLARIATACLLALAALAGLIGRAAMDDVYVNGGHIQASDTTCFALAGVLAFLALVLTPPPFWPDAWHLPRRRLVVGLLALSAAGLGWHAVNYAAWQNVHQHALREGLAQDFGNIHIAADAESSHGFTASVRITARRIAADAPARLATPAETKALHDNIMTNDWPRTTIESNWYQDPDMVTSAFRIEGGILDARPYGGPAAAEKAIQAGKLVMRGEHTVLTIPGCLTEAYGLVVPGLAATDITITGWSRPDSDACKDGAMAAFAGAADKGVDTADLLKRLATERKVVLEQYDGSGRCLISAEFPLDRLAEAQAALARMRDQVRKGDVGPRYSLFRVFVNKDFIGEATKTWHRKDP